MRREINMDFLRIFACFMVVLLHASAQNWHVTDVNSMEWKIFNLYDCAVRSSVPLFIMLSGKFFLGKEELSVSKLFKKNIGKLLVVYFFWSFLYAVDTIGISGVIQIENIPLLINKVINARYHLWYLPTLISIYFLVPILWAAVRFQGGRFVKYMCIMFLVFGILRKTILILMPDFESAEVLFSDFSYALNGLCGYFLFGYVLDKYKDKFAKIKIRVLILAYIIIVGISAKVCEIDAVMNGEPSDLLYGHFMLPVFLESLIIFMIFLKLPVRDMASSKCLIVEKISKYTLFVYLVHVFVLEHIEMWCGFTTLSFNAWVSVPVIAVIVFCISIALAVMFDKVPVLNKWIM